MRKLFGLLLVLGLAAVPAMAQKITIDYAHDFDFGKVKTFQFVDSKEDGSKDQLMDGRIKAAIIRELTEGGLKEVDSDPDLYVTYHISTKENTVFNTTTMGMGGYGGYYGGWGRYGGIGVGTATTTASTYTEGTLLIDAFEPSDKKMVWRGTGTVTVKQKPEKVVKQIDKILTKMGQKWDKILQNQGK